MTVTAFDTYIPVTRFPQGIAQSVRALTGSTDAIPLYSGTVFLTSTGVDATTLATPVAGDDRPESNRAGRN